MLIFFEPSSGAARLVLRAARRSVTCHPPTILVLSVAGALVLSGEARAQLLDRYYPANIPAYQDWEAASAPQQSDSVYGPLGVRVGSFIVNPSLSETVGYDSNPFGSSNGNGSAVVYDSGAIAVNSDWSRNSVNAAFNVNRADFLSYPSQSYTTWTASAGALLNYGDDQIQAGYSHVYGVTLPTDIGTFGLNRPIVDQYDDIRVSDTIGPGRFTLVPALTADLYRFSTADAASFTAGDSLYNRNELTASITAGYEFSGGHNVIVVISNALTDYAGGQTAFRPANYDDVSAMTGLEYKQSALLIYRVLVGYETRSTTSSGLNKGTISAPAAEVDVVWTPSMLTTVTGKIGQSLQDAPIAASQGLNQTEVQLLFRQSVRSDVTLNGSIQYTRASFQASSQVQSVVSLTGEATWSLTRRLALSLRYEYTNAMDGGISADNFDRNQVLLQARFQL